MTQIKPLPPCPRCGATDWRIDELGSYDVELRVTHSDSGYRLEEVDGTRQDDSQESYVRCGACDLTVQQNDGVTPEESDLLFALAETIENNLFDDALARVLDEPTDPVIMADSKASVFMVVQTEDDQAEAWWLVGSFDSRERAVAEAVELAGHLEKLGFSPERLEDSKP